MVVRVVVLTDEDGQIWEDLLRLESWQSSDSVGSDEKKSSNAHDERSCGRHNGLERFWVSEIV